MGGCLLDLVLLYEVLGEAPQLTAMFPVNSLRNFATAQARTPLVAMVDAISAAQAMHILVCFNLYSSSLLVGVGGFPCLFFSG